MFNFFRQFMLYDFIKIWVPSCDNVQYDTKGSYQWGAYSVDLKLAWEHEREQLLVKGVTVWPKCFIYWHYITIAKCPPLTVKSWWWIDRVIYFTGGLISGIYFLWTLNHLFHMLPLKIIIQQDCPARLSCLKTSEQSTYGADCGPA